MASICRICGCELDLDGDGAVSCVTCTVPFHRECWDYAEGCGIYGCGCTDCVDYQAPPPGSLVTIDEATKPPFSLAPYVERLARRFPTWGRTYGTAALLGCAGPVAALLGAIGVCLYGQGMAGVPKLFYDIVRSLSREYEGWVIIGLGPMIGVVSCWLGPFMRRHPYLVSAIGYGASVYVFTHKKFARAFFGRKMGDIIEISLWLSTAVIGSSALAGGATAGRRSIWRRAIFTFACMFLYLLCLTYFHGRMPDLDSMGPFFILALFGMAAAFAPLEFSKSALAHRLKEEAARASEPSAAGSGELPQLDANQSSVDGASQ